MVVHVITSVLRLYGHSDKSENNYTKMAMKSPHNYKNTAYQHDSKTMMEKGFRNKAVSQFKQTTKR